MSHPTPSTKQPPLDPGSLHQLKSRLEEERQQSQCRDEPESEKGRPASRSLLPAQPIGGEDEPGEHRHAECPQDDVRQRAERRQLPGVVVGRQRRLTAAASG